MKKAMTKAGKKPKPQTAYGVYGSHGGIFITATSGHFACVGRLQVYLNESDAMNNTPGNVVKVKIVPFRAQGRR